MTDNTRGATRMCNVLASALSQPGAGILKASAKIRLLTPSQIRNARAITELATNIAGNNRTQDRHDRVPHFALKKSDPWRKKIAELAQMPHLLRFAVDFILGCCCGRRRGDASGNSCCPSAPATPSTMRRCIPRRKLWRDNPHV